ncbi:enoyl-CoA hydratase-related protein, partial [Klebsiella pneumoniae]|uniref:enoyl-CoA hydratase-related protein n=1 Tax=Klebsiella pneumoniae TaxID=573 RepID=UPI001D0E63C2
MELTDGILTVTLSRPDKKNALTNAMYGVLADAIARADAERKVRVLLLRSQGDLFTSGNDIGEFAAQGTGQVS